jgi:hypothetical protein
LFVSIDAGEEVVDVVEVVGGELPVGRGRGSVVAPLEGGEAVSDLGQIGEVVR